jgi:hypothetical protein
MTSPWQSSSATASRSNTGKQQLRFDLALNQSRKTRRISYLWFFQLKSLLAKNVPAPTRATVPSMHQRHACSQISSRRSGARTADTGSGHRLTAECPGSAKTWEAFAGLRNERRAHCSAAAWSWPRLAGGIRRTPGSGRSRLAMPFCASKPPSSRPPGPPLTAPPPPKSGPKVGWSGPK